MVIKPSALRPSSPNAVSAAEVELGVELPADYVAFADVSATIIALDSHSHVVEREGQTTFFLPAIGGRLSLDDEVGGFVMADLSHDEDASPEAVARVLSALRGE